MYEGVSEGHYQRTEVNVLTDKGENLRAFTYVAGPNFLCEEGLPSDEYLSMILSGARYHQLPEAYIQTIECCFQGL